jgi:flagellar basal-body rod modification protein FlgD
MMDVTAQSVSPNPAPVGERQPTAKKTLDYDAFLQLLVAQLQNQDPTQPLDAAEHISQLASFSAVEQAIKTNTKLDTLLTASALAQADSVIGRNVTSADGQTSGKVTSVRIISGGAVAMLENGKQVELSAGVTIT